jgi:hypothetical protein
MTAGHHAGMNDATMIVPVGDFTPEIARRVRETALETAQQRDVVISLRATIRYSWGALNELTEALRSAATPYRIRLTEALPRARALFHELGIGQGWFVEATDVATTAPIHITA